VKLYRLFPLLALACATASAGTTWRGTIGSSGVLQLRAGRRPVATVTPGIYGLGWRSGGYAGAKPDASGVLKGILREPGGATVDVELRVSDVPDGIRLAYRLIPRKTVRLNALCVTVELPIAAIAGRAYAVDGAKGTVPAALGKNIHLRSGTVRTVALEPRGGSPLQIAFEKPTYVLVQDNRQWGPSLSVRMGHSGEEKDFPAGQAFEIAFTLTAQGGIAVTQDKPVIIQAGKDWIPLDVALDIEPGSALDFSGMGQLDAPAGKHGRVVARPDGTFAFEKDPDTPRRFYGVNLCFGAQYVEHALSDRVAERLARVGYNAVRFHHYERDLVDRSKGTSTTARPDPQDKLDYLFAALKKRGIYVTTDLFVSRPLFAAEVYDGAQGDLAMNDIKMAVPVNARAFENWKAFARTLLGHTNPYTKMTYAADPALAWLCMINEGNFGNFLGRMDKRVEADWKAAWNRWLAARYPSADALKTAWGTDPKGDPAKGTVPLHKDARDDSARGRDLAAFLTATERDMLGRMRTFLRDELGCKALLTDMNGWTNVAALQAARADFDYVDDHFYVDHPRWVGQPWRLPSRCPNTSPIAAGAPGGRHLAFVRLLDKPFTCSEYNYSGPGRFRGVGGILTGCLGALQGWDVIWRFTYSHSREALAGPVRCNYFDIAADPLNQAAERAAICLYLRGDMKPATHTVGIRMPREAIAGKTPARNVSLAPGWNALALVTRVGTFLAESKATADIVLDFVPKKGELDPYAGDTGEKVLELMRSKGWLEGNATDLSKNVIQSETGQLTIDAPRDVMVLDTPRTAGGYAPEGETIHAGPVTIAVTRTDATVWVSSLDDNPIPSSKRLLLTHLTDLQNTGVHFGEQARQTLHAWGDLPHLVLAGSATVTLDLPNAKTATVWAIATSGRRLEKVAATLADGKLTVPVATNTQPTARLMYEIEVQ